MDIYDLSEDEIIFRTNSSDELCKGILRDYCSGVWTASQALHWLGEYGIIHLLDDGIRSHLEAQSEAEDFAGITPPEFQERPYQGFQKVFSRYSGGGR